MPHTRLPIATNVAFIDASLPDVELLIGALPSATEVHLLPSDRDGMEFIAHALIGRSGIETLHLLCHGAPGALHLGTATLQRANLTRYLNLLDILRDTMVEHGEWLIYGCEVAQGEAGRRFVEALRLMTGLQVAAASHKVGAEKLGGSWVLDDAPHASVRSLAVPQWEGVLAAPTISFPTTLSFAPIVDFTVGKIAVAPLKGLNTHLAIAKPLKLAGVDVAKLTVAPFRSSADSMTALLGGHVDVVSATDPTVVPMAQAGRVRILVSAAAERGTGPLAKVPTWREEGVAADYVSYNGVLLPAGVDAEQIRFWEQALKQVAASPEWIAMVEKSGNKPIFKGYVDSHRYMQSEFKLTQELVAELGLNAL
ncbi:MAG: tripartite tricarboxylate transporter substrate-binding protein [Burkholderiales bacterium]|nr:tripartite tricarboxylate transporter substrate-binding protein [Burkholderiales bacterium]